MRVALTMRLKSEGSGAEGAGAGKLSQQASALPEGAPLGQPFAGRCFRGFCHPGSLYFSGDRLGMDSVRGEACPLMKWRGTKTQRSSSTEIACFVKG